MKNIYLDIDGVLLDHRTGQPAKHLDEFMEKAIANHKCYWLTTHCKGDTDSALEQFRGKVGGKTLKLLERVRPTNWSTLKSEGINFEEDFLWLDDNLFESEKNILHEYGAEKKIILVNLNENPDQLVEIAKVL